MGISRLISHISNKKIDRFMRKLESRGLKIGERVSVQTPFFFDPSHCFLISIGDRCTFAPDVRLIAHDASTKRALGFTKIGPIKIGNDCFIGAGCIVLCGVEIGDNCIVGAGSVLSKSVPPNSVVTGNPARVIGKTSDYLEKHKSAAENSRVFGAEYQIENMDAERKAELLEFVKHSSTYVK
jgi:maltose O-acetyltransferase